MTKDDSYHKKRGNGFVYSPEREVYKTDELRYALEELQNLHEQIWEIKNGELKPTEKLEFLDNATAYAYGFGSEAIDMFERYTNLDCGSDDYFRKEFEKLAGSKDFEKGSKKGQEFTNAILSYNASDRGKEEICQHVIVMVTGIAVNSNGTIDGSRL